MKLFLKTYTNRITVTLLITLIITIVVMRIFDAPLKNEVCTNGIISFELAKDLSESVKIIESWDVSAKLNAGLSLGFDFLFLLVYSSFIALLVFRANERLWQNKAFYAFGKLLIVFIFMAALFDGIENVALVKLLLGDYRQVWSSVAYYFATIKFVIIFICIAYLIINWSLLLVMSGRKE